MGASVLVTLGVVVGAVVELVAVLEVAPVPAVPSPESFVPVLVGVGTLAPPEPPAPVLLGVEVVTVGVVTVGLLGVGVGWVPLEVFCVPVLSASVVRATGGGAPSTLLVPQAAKRMPANPVRTRRRIAEVHTTPLPERRVGAPKRPSTRFRSTRRSQCWCTDSPTWCVI